VQGCTLSMQGFTEARTGRSGYSEEGAKRNPLRADRTNMFNPCLNNYKSKDGAYFMLTGLEVPRHMPKILKALKLDRLLPEIKGFPQNRAMLIKELDQAFAELTMEQISKAFDAADVWYAPVRKYEDMLHDEQANACGAFVTVPNVNTKLLASPVLLSAADSRPKTRAPLLGEHNDEIFGPLRSKL